MCMIILIFGWGLDVCIKLSLEANDIACLLVAHIPLLLSVQKFNTWAAFMEIFFSVCVCVCVRVRVCARVCRPLC